MANQVCDVRVPESAPAAAAGRTRSLQDSILVTNPTPRVLPCLIPQVPPGNVTSADFAMSTV